MTASETVLNQESKIQPITAGQTETLINGNRKLNGDVLLENGNQPALINNHPVEDRSMTEKLQESIEQQAQDRNDTLRRNIYCILIALGIILSFATYAYFLERVTRDCYGIEDENKKCSVKFSYAQSLSGVCFFVYWAVARLILLIRPPNKVDETSVWYYLGCALAYVLAFLTSTMALKWVAYPVQIVTKSAKPIPVIMLGALIGGKSYTYRKYFFVILIVVGVILFIYKDGGTNKNYTGFGWGEPLLFFSLAMDGVLGAIEERIRSSTAPSALQMMAAINGWSALLIIAPILITNEGVEFVQFAAQYPRVLAFMAALVSAGAIGQIFIFAMVTMFGALACSVATTIRKVISLLFSALFMGNHLMLRQWGGAALVFGALFGDMIFRKKPQPKH